MNLQIGDLTGQGQLLWSPTAAWAPTPRPARQGLQPPSTKLADSLATMRLAGA
jgi:hypothetical protein